MNKARVVKMAQDRRNKNATWSSLDCGKLRFCNDRATLVACEIWGTWTEEQMITDVMAYI